MPKKGYKQTLEHRQNTSHVMKKRIFSDKHRRNLSLAAIGNDSGKYLKNTKLTKKAKENMKASWTKNKEDRLKKIWSNRKWKDTIPELTIEKWLRLNKISYIKQILVECHSIDFFIKTKKLCIFVDGDYWHANPNIYKENDKMFGCYLAKNIWDRDRKITEKLKKSGFEVIRIWESEIKSKNFCKLERLFS